MYFKILVKTATGKRLRDNPVTYCLLSETIVLERDINTGKYCMETVIQIVEDHRMNVGEKTRQLR